RRRACPAPARGARARFWSRNRGAEKSSTAVRSTRIATWSSGTSRWPSLARNAISPSCSKNITPKRKRLSATAPRRAAITRPSTESWSWPRKRRRRRAAKAPRRPRPLNRNVKGEAFSVPPAHLPVAPQFGKLRSYTLNGGKWELKRLLFLFVAVIVFSALNLMSGAAQTDNQSKDARAAVNKFFLLLKSRSYPALYEFLPSDLQRIITREQLALSLMRLDTFI